MQLYMITVQDNEAEGEEILGYKDGDLLKIYLEDNPQLSLHALKSTYNFQTIKVRGYIGRKSLCIMIDLGSTHNFIDVRVITKLGCVLEPIEELKVIVANGNELKCIDVCKSFSWTM